MKTPSALFRFSTRAACLAAALAAGADLACPAARADGLAVGAGQGNVHSQHTDILVISYLKRAQQLFGRDSLYDLTFAAWDGHARNQAITIGRSLRWKLGAGSQNYFSAGLGLGMVKRTTEHLGTKGQFIFRAALGRRFGAYDLSIGETHYSNGKTIFGWEGPNRGDNFFSVLLAREW